MIAGCPCACGDGFFPLRASAKAQSSGQNGHNHNRLYQFQSISPPFVARCSARVGSHGQTTFLSSALDVSPEHLDRKSSLNHNRRALIHQLEQFDHVRVTHTHTAMTRSRADLVLVFGAVDVYESVARIGIVLVQSVEP